MPYFRNFVKEIRDKEGFCQKCRIDLEQKTPVKRDYYLINQKEKRGGISAGSLFIIGLMVGLLLVAITVPSITCPCCKNISFVRSSCTCCNHTGMISVLQYLLTHI